MIQVIKNNPLIILLRKDFNLHKGLFFVLIFALVASYSVYFFGEEWVDIAGKEDGIFEYLTALFFLLGAAVFGWTFYQNRKIFFLLLSIVLLVGCGEEISWGQRIFGFTTPEYLHEHNVQDETSLHNLEILNAHDFAHTEKTGWRKLFTINFLYKLFCMSYGVILPALVGYVGFVKSMVQKIGLPVPPLLLGGVFLLNWVVFRIILSALLPSGKGAQYYYSVGEIAECISAAVFFISAIALMRTERSKTVAASKE
jgi:hypothetical protein